MFPWSAEATVLWQVTNPVIGNLLLIVPLALIMYFLMWAPMSRQRKKMQELLSNLKNGDKVITNGGLLGTIVGIEGDTVQLRIADQVKVKVLRSAVASLQAETKEES
jgi:preprotein translocase subunit YajC